ncbi:hypothetical protein GCM10023146_23790 [Nocardioides caricicola]
MAYQPSEGWVHVAWNPATGEVHSQRLHADRSCAERAVEARRAKAQLKGSPVESYLSDKMPYAQARRLRQFSVCKCTGSRHTGHAVNENRNPREILQGPPGSGRRR